MPDARDVLVVPHTHWDREWYHVAGRFRQRLVALVDELLADDSGAPFLLDGQAVVLDDYLAVRPGRREALAAALGAGRLEAGPWYVLADGLIPGGESLVRNLLAGRRALAALGAAPPPVLYAPDAFGHPAAGPTLAAGFGFEVAVVWRGYGGARWPAGDAAWWAADVPAAAGSAGPRVLLYHLPPDGYELGSRLPPTLPAARERWAALRAVLEPRARLDVLLVPNGADHHARQERWAEAVDALRRAAEPARVEAASLSAFARRARAAADAADLPTVRGELRDSYGYAWTLQGTFASRAAQKRRAARAERALVRDAEPWAALATLGTSAGAGAWPADTRAALLAAAWRELLLCHPHDTLCGCSLDAVARAMDGRLDEVESQAEGVRREALAALAGHDPVRARGLRMLWRPQALVRNRAPRARAGVAEVAVQTFVRDVPVGPGSAGAWGPVRPPGAPVRLALGASPVPTQVLGRALAHDRIESPRHYPDDDLVEVARVLAWVPAVPGYGALALGLDERGDAPAPGAPAADGGPARPAQAGDGFVDNGRVRVAVDPRGRVSLHDAARGLTLDDALGFEDVGDAGDLYTHSPVGNVLTFARCVGVRVVDRGPLRATLEARYELRVPEGLAADPDDEWARPTRRAGRAVTLAVTVRFSVDAGAPFVRVRVTGGNRARDHRFRIMFRTGLADARVVADAAFGPVERRPLAVPPADAAAERPPRTAPLHRYVTLSGDAYGTTVFSDGLAEYEATPEGAVAVTLVRAVGELSRPDLPERPGHAGWPAATPEAQSQGPFAAELGVALHAPDDDATRALVEHLADDVLLPLAGETVRAAVHPLHSVASCELAGEAFAFGAAKPAECGGGWVTLRVVNVTDAPARGEWRVVRPDGAALAEAVRARLDETPGEALTVAARGGASVVAFAAAPREAVTVLVR